MKNFLILILIVFALGCQKQIVEIPMEIGECWEHVQIINGENLDSYNWGNYWVKSNGNTEVRVAFLWDCRLEVLKITKGEDGEVIGEVSLLKGQWVPSSDRCNKIYFIDPNEDDEIRADPHWIGESEEGFLVLTEGTYAGTYQKRK